jgi:hypothetical protein
MKIKKNGVTINLTESDLKRIVKSQMINENPVNIIKKIAKDTSKALLVKTAGFTPKQEEVINDIYDKINELSKSL